MKKVLLAASIASALALVNVAQAASGGTITFNGQITDQTCQVVIGSAANATITLPTTPATELSAAGSVAGKTPINFNLTGCNAVGPTPLMPAAKNFGVVAYFEPDVGNVDLATNLLKNTAAAADAAQKVGLQLLFPDQSEIKLGNGLTEYTSHYTSVSDTDTSANMTYWVQYKSIDGGATAGKVTSQVVYKLSYQ